MESVKAYSLKAQGDMKLSKHFRVREFRCRDGTDLIVVDDKLVWLLELIREHFVDAITITSGYRTASHNKHIGGAKNSMHMTGKAADIKVRGVDPADVANYVDSLLPNSGGIGRAKTYTHIDTRDIKSRWTY